MEPGARNSRSTKIDIEGLPAISLAVQWIRKGLEILLGILADDPRLPAEVLEQYYRQHALHQIVACQFKTNDLVTLVYGRRSGRFQINATPIDLDNREFLVLKALAVNQRSLPQPAFVPMEAILAHIEAHREEARLVDRWRYPMPEDVRRVVLSIRTKIQEVGGNRFLIEGKYGDGYRISSPHVEIISCSPPQNSEA